MNQRGIAQEAFLRRCRHIKPKPCKNNKYSITNLNYAKINLGYFSKIDFGGCS